MSLFQKPFPIPEGISRSIRKLDTPKVGRPKKELKPKPVKVPKPPRERVVPEQEIRVQDRIKKLEELIREKGPMDTSEVAALFPGVHRMTILRCLKRVPGLQKKRRQGIRSRGGWLWEVSPTDESHSASTVRDRE